VTHIVQAIEKADQVVIFSANETPSVKSRTGCHLLLNPNSADLARLAERIRELIGEFLKPVHVSYNADICAGGTANQEACGICITACPYDAIKRDPENHLRMQVDHMACEGCGACALVCPEQAIAIRDVVNGRLNIFDNDNMLLVSGALHIGESSSGHLVDVVKRKAKEEAEKRGADLILTNGPPGIGCPVIASMKGSDYLIAVTEPTPSALHDLKKLLEVAGYFKTPVGIVINKSDMPYGTKEAIVQFAGKSEMTILSEIPYDMSIPRAMAQARPVVAVYPDSSSSLALRELAYKLKDMIMG